MAPGRQWDVALAIDCNADLAVGCDRVVAL
jgi:hypothetical protein